MVIHVVKAGQTLWQISEIYGVSMESVIAANGLADPDRLAVGEALVIPVEWGAYTVKSGDTLWKIAQKHGTTPEALLKANDIAEPDNIAPGLRLNVPAARHRVMPGETLYLIGWRYGVAPAELARANGISDPNMISAGAELVIPRRPRPVLGVNGYIYMLGEAAVPIIDEVGRHLTYLSPFAYLIKEDGSLQQISDGPAIRAAKEKNAAPMMAVTNFTATSRGENLASLVLNSPERMEALLSNCLDVMKRKGYKGLNVDFENVLPKDREAYNAFLERAAALMHKNGYFFSTAVAPKTGPAQAGLLYEAHDYAAHGRLADFVILMTYEWGYRKGPPQAISPINRIREVLDYAVSVIPPAKIYLGFQIYARDWKLPFKAGDEAATFSPQEAVALAVEYGAEILYDYAAESPYFRYYDSQGSRHEVWFEDARSAQAKFDAARDYGLAGISYWALGYPFPQNWVLLEDNFNIKKM